MDFDHNNVRRVVEEDRLSRLPDELLHKIMSSFDMKFVVQTCLLSPRWKFLWTSMPCLNFSSEQFGTLPKFSKFVTNVLSHRNHQIEVSSIKLHFRGAASQVFVRKIATYATSHNVQELTVRSYHKKNYEFPPCLFSSQSLKHFTLGNPPFSFLPCVTPKTPWDFPNLTTMHLNDITLSGYNTVEHVDIFSKCVNLKNLTLKGFIVRAVEVFDIITPQLSNLKLIDGHCPNTINLIAPQLENLTIIKCSIKYFNAPPGLSSFQYRDNNPIQLSKDRLHSLDEVSIYIYYYGSEYKEEDAYNTINMLQQLHSAKYLTLNWDIIECISSFPDLFSHHPTPFSNLIHLTIGSSERKNAYKVKMSTEARNFLIANSPNAIMKLPEEPPTKAMKQKEARAKKKAKQAAEIESHMMELQALLEEGNMVAERKRAKENANVALKNLMAKQPLLSLQKMKLSLEKMKMEVEQGKVLTNSHNTSMQVQGGKADAEAERLMAQFKICVGEMRSLVEEETSEAIAILVKEAQIGSLLENLPKRERAQVEARYSTQLEETKAHSARLLSEILASQTIFACEKLLLDNISTYQDVSGSKIPLVTQMHSSSST